VPLRAVLSLAALAACTGGQGGPTPARSVPVESVTASTSGSGDVQANGVPHTLDLGRGRQSAEWAIEALDPPTHSYTVRIVASGHPDLEVWLTNVHGVRLNVLPGTQEHPSCNTAPAELECVAYFPALEAQQGGIWILHVVKRTTAASRVTVTIAFEPIGPA